MDELRRFVEAGGKLVDSRRDITRRQLSALGLVLDSAVTLGCVVFGGLDVEIAFWGWVGSLIALQLIAALSDRG